MKVQKVGGLRKGNLAFLFKYKPLLSAEKANTLTPCNRSPNITTSKTQRASLGEKCYKTL